MLPHQTTLLLPEVLNRKDFPGRRLPPNTILIDRRTIWGNPFIGGLHGTRDEVCDMHEKWLLENTFLLGRLYLLKGRNLLCHCAPKRCHGHTLRRYANPDLVFDR